MKFFISLMIAMFAFANDFERNNTTNIVIDKKMNLLWEDDTASATQNVSYKNALTYCHELNINGLSGWRVPSSAELSTIIDANRTPTIDNSFRHAATGGYWCNEQKKLTTAVYWIDFSDGVAYSGSGLDRHLFVRCVRNNKPH
jgi:hypothetical protein